jgi:hypothetical protein
VNLLGRFVSWVFPPGPEIFVHEMCDSVAPGEAASWPVTSEGWRRYADLKIVGFLENRIGEIEDADPDGAAKCRDAIDNCCERIDVSPSHRPGTRSLRGEITDMRSLKRLARNWADHPDFRPEWETL